MSVALRRVRERIRMRLQDFDAHHPVYDTIQIDQETAESYLYLSARLPASNVYQSSALTISAGADTFALPNAVSQWVGNNGGAQYRGDVRIRLRSTGQFLYRRTVEELDDFRSAFQVNTTTLTIPDQFALWEDKTQTVQGRCWPGAASDQVCDLYLSLDASDLRDYVGAGTDDLDDVVLEMSRNGVLAVVEYTAGCLLGKMSPEKAQGLGLDKSEASEWKRKAEMLIYTDTVRHHQIKSIGRTQRWVG